MTHMPKTVGVRELRRELSGYRRRVEQGESFAVTSRGRGCPARPSPGNRDPITRLSLERNAIPARIDLLDVEPLELPSGPPLSEALDEVRADRQ